MPSVKSGAPCTICGVNESVMHAHHTVPQSRGGKDSLQIVLCSGCHNVLHANANYLVSRIRNPKRPAKQFWKNEHVSRSAERWLQILVQSLLSPNEEAATKTEHPVTANLSGSDFQKFKILARDLGCSHEKAVLYCIKTILSGRGLDNENTTKPELWFLPVSKS